MEHHDRSFESPRPNRRQFLVTSGSTVAEGRGGRDVVIALLPRLSD